MDAELNKIIVNTKQLANLFGVSESYISDLVTDHGMPKLAFNQFNLIDCVKFRFSHLEKIFQDQKNKLRDLTNRGRLDAANAELKELELQEKKGSLVLVQEVEMVLKNEALLYKKGLESLSGKLKFDMNLTPEQTEILSKNINDILNQLSNLPPDANAEYVDL